MLHNLFDIICLIKGCEGERENSLPFIYSLETYIGNIGIDRKH